MWRYLLALYREYAVPSHPEQMQRVPADGDVLGDRLTGASTFVCKTGLLPAESATAAKLTGNQAS